MLSSSPDTELWYMLLTLPNVELHNTTMKSIDDNPVLAEHALTHTGVDPLRDDWAFGSIIRHLKTMPSPPEPDPEPSPDIPFKTPREFISDMGFRTGDVINQTHIIKRYSAMYKKVPHKEFAEVFQKLGYQETSPRHWLVR